MRTSSVKQKKRSRAVAHQVGNGQGMGYPAVQRMKEDNNNQGGKSFGKRLYDGLFELKKWGGREYRRKKRELSVSGYKTYIKYLGPDVNDIEDLANFLGISYEALYDHLNDLENFDEIPNSGQHLQKLVEAYGSTGKSFLGLVPDYLLANLEYMNDAEKMDTIFARFHNYPFTYSGSGTATQGFLRKKGDCGTLVDMFMYAVEAAGIKGVKLMSRREIMLCAPGHIHGRGTTGNVHGSGDWCFEDHYWCVHQGKIYDVLFMQNELQPTVFNPEQKQHGGVSYLLFGNGHCVLAPGTILPGNPIPEGCLFSGTTTEEAMIGMIEEAFPGRFQGQQLNQSNLQDNGNSNT